MCNMYSCRFRMATHRDLNDGTLGPQSSVLPPISWDSANIIYFHMDKSPNSAMAGLCMKSSV